MINAVDLKSIEKLRANFRQIVGKNRKKRFDNKNSNISFVFNRLSINKIGCIKSIKNSISNGFTLEEHFEAAENIKELFEQSKIVLERHGIKSRREVVHYLCVCPITDGVFAFMPVVLFGEGEGYIDLYLKKVGE